MTDYLRLRKEILKEEKGEKGRKGILNVALIYPENYNIAISTLAFHRIFELTNRVRHTGVGRFFFEGNKKSRAIFSLDNQFDIREAQVLAFFLSYELDFINLLRSLKSLSIPLESRKRSGFPIIIGGGTAVTENPEPLADVLDIIFLGEAEESYPAFLNLCLEYPDKNTLLKKVKDIEGIYIPSIDSIPSKRIFYKNFENDFARSVFYTTRAEFGECELIEISRGCPAFCRFCISRTLYSPPRFACKELVKHIIEVSSVKKVGFLGAATSFHPHIKEMMDFALQRGKNFSISSLRTDLVDREFLRLLKAGGTKTVTLAPEAGTQRLRDIINKGVNEGHIEKAVFMSLQEGMENLKLYFMYGLPEEEMEDLDGIIKIAEKIRKIEKDSKSFFKKRIFTLSPFVPKPNTPFSKQSFMEIKELSKRINYLRKNLIRFGIEVSYDHPKTARLEWEIAHGSRDYFRKELEASPNP